MSKEPELKARDKVVVRMTREGAVEENLTAGTEQRVSKRLEDAELVKPGETAEPSEALSAEEQKKVQMRRQQRQFQAEHGVDNDTQPPSETSVTEEKKPDNPPQNVSEPLPSETPFKPPTLEQHGVSSHTGTVIAETVVTQKQESVEQKDFEMNADTSGLTVAGHIGTWHTIDQHEVGGHSFYLMEHDTYGDEAACIIVDERGKLVLDDVYNGFDDDTLRLLDLEVKEVPEMPDPALSVQDMKDYGYAWAGVLPAGQEAAEKALEKGCEVYRLYSDNTEGLCVDAKEIADHAAKGGMLGISKESWMAALEKENYLKAAEMSMEDDYGMIDGIINNGPKEDKTAEVKAPERGEKSSIMDRLKSAKAEKQKECCPPKKHKGEIEL